MRDVRAWLRGTLTLTLLGCSSSTTTPNPVDAAVAQDMVTVDSPSGSDAPRADGPRADAPSTGQDGGLGDVPTRASGPCTSDDDCAGLSCDDTVGGGFCSADCTNSASQVTEQRQCGRGGTCLSIGDEDPTTFCARACTPSARTEATGACRAGTICTSWWYTHADDETPGCDVFCATDANCLTGEHCHPRTGFCEDTAPSTTLRADGEACNPQMEPDQGPSTQCRGICFAVSDEMHPREGICGSLVNLGVTTRCPDLPDRIFPEAPSNEDGRTDNLGLCIYKTCTTAADCAAPLQCTVDTAGGPSYCDYASNGDPIDGGTGDAAVTDAARTDATSADAASTDAGARD